MMKRGYERALAHEKKHTNAILRRKAEIIACANKTISYLQLDVIIIASDKIARAADGST